MCGHVGVAGDLNLKGPKVFKDLLYMDGLRGLHGTGVATIPFLRDSRPDKSKTKIFKAPIPVYNLMTNPDFDRLVSSQAHGAIIGHNRHATQGAKTHENTHPFMAEKVVGAHNGTVSAGNRNYPKVEGSYGTDSEEILNSISINGVKETITNMTTDSWATGAWALVWYDYEEDTINFIRNEHRTLFYAHDKPRDMIFWASERRMLQSALERNGVDYNNAIYTVPEDTLLKWVVPSQGERFRAEPTSTALAGKEPVKTVYTSNTKGLGPWSGYDNGYGAGTKSITHDTSSKRSNKLAVPASFDAAFKGRQIDTEKINTMFKYNKSCVWCKASVSVKDVRDGKAQVVCRDTVVCQSCAERPAVSAMLNLKVAKKTEVSTNVKKSA